MLNAKTQRPGVCNAAETLIVHADAAPLFVPRILRALSAAGVVVRGDERVIELAEDESEEARNGVGASQLEAEASLSDSALVQAASEEDWGTEYLALTLAVRVVDSIGQAIEHIGRYGSGHSEAIVTSDTAAHAPSSWGSTRPACT